MRFRSPTKIAANFRPLEVLPYAIFGNVPEPQMTGSTVLIAAGAASANPIDWKLRSGVMQKNHPLSFPAPRRQISQFVGIAGNLESPCDSPKRSIRSFDRGLKLRSQEITGLKNTWMEITMFVGGLP